MPSEDNSDKIRAQLQERMFQLPKVVQNAITSADVEKQLRALANVHKLHIDQWSALENEVMLTLMGLQDISELSTNIQSEVGVSSEEAVSLAADISKIVFEPIRAELERQLEHPEAKEKEMTGIEASREEMLSNENEPAPADAELARVPLASDSEKAPPVLPATPGQPPPTEKAVRAPLSSAYTSQQPSSNRKIVEGDPYREMPK